MIVGLLATIVPLVIYIALVSLPRGRKAVMGIAVVALALLLAYLAFRKDPSLELVAVIAINAGAVVVAALAQVIRIGLGRGRPGWLYPAVAAGLALAAGVPALNILGI